MAMNDILREFDTLPPEAQKQVVDFIAFLQTRYRALPADKTKPGRKIDSEVFIGIWRERSDLQDSSGWVRKARTAEWG